MDHVQPFEFQILDGVAHGTRDGRRTGALHLQTPKSAAAVHDQVDLGTRVGGPEVTLPVLYPERADRILEDEAFPGGTHLGVSFESLSTVDVQQAVKQARVSDVHLGRPDLAFAQIRAPGIEAPHHECRFQRVQVAADGVVRDAERAGEFRTVPDLGMVVGEHAPEPFERCGGDRDSESRDVSLKERADEIPPPTIAASIAARREGRREAAPQPELIHPLRPGLGQREDW